MRNRSILPSSKKSSYRESYKHNKNVSCSPKERLLEGMKWGEMQKRIRHCPLEHKKIPHNFFKSKNMAMQIICYKHDGKECE